MPNKKITNAKSKKINLGSMVAPDILYKKLVKHLNEAIWIGDKNERTLYANPKFCKLMEYSLEEMLGKKSYEFWDEESSELIRNIKQSKRSKSTSSSYEGNLLTRTGKKIAVLLNNIPLPNGETIGIMTDVTELKKKQESEKILNTAIQHASDAMIIFDSNGIIKSWNQGAKMIFGYKKEEIVGEKLDKLFSTDQIASFFQQSRGYYSHFEIKSNHKSERSLNITATLTSIVNDRREPPLYLLVARDITNHAQFEEELALKYQKIQEAYNKFGLVRRQMDYIFEILELLGSSYDQKSIADYIVSSLIMLTRTDACVMRMYNKEKNTLKLISSFGVKDWDGKANIKYEGSLTEKAHERKSPLKIIDIASETRYQSSYLAKKNNLSSLLLIPLEFQGQIIGSLSLYASPEKKLAIFENDFIEKYSKIIEIAIYTIFFKI